MKTPTDSHSTRRCARFILPTIVAALCLPMQVHAATNIYWDTLSGNGQLDAGSGSWNANSSNTVWTSSTAGTPITYWTSGPGIQAVFGGTSATAAPYTINVSSSGIQAQIVRFTSSGYVLTSSGSSTIALGYGVTTTGPQLGGISLATGVTATVGDGVTVVSGTSGSQPMTLWGAGTLNIISSSASAPAIVKAGVNNNTNVGGGITVVVGTNGVLQSALITNGGSGNGSLVVGYDAGDATLKVDGGTVNFASLVVGSGSATGLSVVNLESGTVSSVNSTGVVRFGPSSGTTTSGTAILNLNGGTLSIGGITVGGAGSAAYSVNFNGGLVQVTGGTATVNLMASSSQLTASVKAGGAIIDTNGHNVTIGQALVSGTTNDGGLTKQGVGTLTLNGVNTYNGATTVKSGSLVVGASSNISSTLVLGGSGGYTGTLDVSLKGSSYTQANISGAGTIIGAANSTITATGLVNPGINVGELDVSSNFTLAGAASTNMEISGLGGIAGTDFDYIHVGGTLTTGGSLSITAYDGFDLTQAGTYDLFSFTNKNGTFSSVTVNGVSLSLTDSTWSDASGQYSFEESNGTLSVAAVPEPATYAILVSGIGMLGMLRRKFRA